MSLKSEYFTGTVLSDPDPKNLGRYKVHSEELHLRLLPTDGQYFRNHISTYRYSPSDKGYVGVYMPLQVGMYVLLKIDRVGTELDYNNGSIVQVLSDDSVQPNNTVMPFSVHDRDDLYLLLRTTKYDSIISITEDTVDEPAKTLHVYHNGSKIIMDANGIHITTQNQSVSISGASNINIAGDCNLQVGGSTNVKSVGPINMDGQTINLNSGLSTTNTGYNTYPSTKELKGL